MDIIFKKYQKEGKPNVETYKDVLSYEFKENKLILTKKEEKIELEYSKDCKVIRCFYKIIEP